MEKIVVTPEDVYIHLKCKTGEEVLSFLTNRLVEDKRVKKEYVQAILDREYQYPTGLYTGDISVALPHADYRLVNESAIIIGVLDAPVTFRQMSDPDAEVAVSVVILLALKDPHGHTDVLKQVTDLIQEQDALKKITEATNRKDIYGIISKYF